SAGQATTYPDELMVEITFRPLKEGAMRWWGPCVAHRHRDGRGPAHGRGGHRSEPLPHASAPHVASSQRCRQHDRINVMTEMEHGGAKRRVIAPWGGAIMGGLAALAGAGTLYQAVAAWRDAQAYPPPGRVVDVG